MRGSFSLLFLIRSLNYGGAERQVVALAAYFRQKGEPVAVATLYGGGPWQKELEAAGVPHYPLGKAGRWDVMFVFRLLKLVRTMRPTILYSFLGTANILAAACKLALRPGRIVWSVRASDMDLRWYGWMDRLLYRLECGLSGCADLIISNSHAGLNHALAHGFPRKKMMIIGNGIDTERFFPDSYVRITVRRHLGVADKDYLIGLVGRLDPMKDHPTFLEAAALLIRQRKDVRFLCIGDGQEPYRSQLRHMADGLGLSSSVIWLSAVEDMASTYNAMDVMTSSSCFGEGFSNAIAEAMACGVPCVVTTVGDSPRLVGETGCVVPVRDPSALCAGWVKLMDLDTDSKREQSRKVRDHIVQHFGMQRLVSETWDALQAIR